MENRWWLPVGLGLVGIGSIGTLIWFNRTSKRRKEMEEEKEKKLQEEWEQKIDKDLDAQELKLLRFKMVILEERKDREFQPILDLRQQILNHKGIITMMMVVPNPITAQRMKEEMTKFYGSYSLSAPSMEIYNESDMLDVSQHKLKKVAADGGWDTVHVIIFPGNSDHLITVLSKPKPIVDPVENKST